MKLLIDEMFPATSARRLRNDLCHDAMHVTELGLRGADDIDVAEVARSGGRALVTEKVADFVREPDLVVVCVLKRNLPAGGAQAPALAELIDRWATANPRPYVGQHCRTSAVRIGW